MWSDAERFMASPRHLLLALCLGFALLSGVLSHYCEAFAGPSNSEQTVCAGSYDTRRGMTRERREIRASITAEERREVYRTFKSELTGYRLQGFAVRPDVDLRRVRADLKGGTSFADLKLRYARPSQELLLSRLWRPEQLFELLGPQATEAITSLRVGQALAVSSRHGGLLIQLVAIEDSYEQLAPVIDELLYQSKLESYRQRGTP